jgi:hypothetical protein
MHWGEATGYHRAGGIGTVSMITSSARKRRIQRYRQKSMAFPTAHVAENAARNIKIPSGRPRSAGSR